MSDLVRISVGWDRHFPISLYVNGWLFLCGFALFVLVAVLMKWSRVKAMFHSWKPVELEINLGHVGKVKLCPEEQERQIAHRIWTELVTRKAAVPIDLENDVIVEVYDSWYALFQCIRMLVGEICAADLPSSDSKRSLVAIAVQTLNEGLRPHLTIWQARLRSWLDSTHDQYRHASPQEHQRYFPEYDRLCQDLVRVNAEIVQYAAQLKKMIDSD